MGHHGGLPAKADLMAFIQEGREDQEVLSAVDIAKQIVRGITPPGIVELPFFLRSPHDVDFFLRMLFSALVDADFLDTEDHFHPEQGQLRDTPRFDADELQTRLESAYQALPRRCSSAVQKVRDSVYKRCQSLGHNSPGAFSLTVPTGGGKTLSAMAFALEHAATHKLERVVVAIPYTSITEQTADVYRCVFGDVVLEHHSAANPIHESVWSRLAAENWDAPIVVTTTVQLFESLFSNRPSSCRKLHRLANSVLILDEVQTLPVELLEPILDGLRQLVENYRTTVLLCTATQPALEEQIGYTRGLGKVTEIIPNSPSLFAQMQRVHFEYASQPISWEQASDAIREHRQALAVLNTKPDALALLDALCDPAAFHLSTLLCGAHRRDVLREVKQKLAAGEPCRLVSTQVIEAGVDLDFPVVFRAVGPLDRIVQVGGRCNREGRITGGGRVAIFKSVEGGCPPGSYRVGTQLAENLLESGVRELDHPELHRAYFRRLFENANTDSKSIQERRAALDFPCVAERFRMIPDETEPVLVKYASANGSQGAQFIEMARSGRVNPRALMRKIQPFVVNVRRRDVQRLQREGLLVELPLGLWEWLGEYDRTRGIIVQGRNPADFVV